MSKPTRDPSVVWAGIPSGTYRIHALGAPRDVTVDLTHFEVRLDLGGPEATLLTEPLVTQALDKVRATLRRPVRDKDADEWREECLRVNGERAVSGDHLWCAFDSDADPDGIPDGYECGGCACHLSAPCRHCMTHLPGDDEAWRIAAMLDLTGRSTA